MNSVRLIFCAFVLILTIPLFADKKEMIWTFSGSDCGKTVYEINPDGTFTSETDLTIAGMVIKSSFTGRLVNGELVEFKIDQDQAGTKQIVVAANGKVKMKVNDKDIPEQDFKPSKVFMANFHPWTADTMVAAFNPNPTGAQKMPTYSPDTLRDLNIDALAKPSRTVDVAGEKHAVQVLHMRAGMLEFDVFSNENKEIVGWDVPSQKLTVQAVGYEKMLVDPSTLYPELSQPTLAVKTEKSVKIPMRDGVNTIAEIAIPTGDGKYPTILIRTPYGRLPSFGEADWWAKRGYALVSQDVRGRGDSEGDWVPLFHERKDGYDTIDWISKQPWSNGKVGMIGGSYLGWVQWEAAVEKPAALKCIIPQVSPPDPFFNFPYDHGIPYIFGAVWWARAVSTRTLSSDLLADVKNTDKFNLLPLPKIDEAVLGTDIPFVNDWWTRDTSAKFAGANYGQDMKNVTIPAFHVSGWWDGDGIGTKINYQRMRDLGRTNQYLIYGPWTHFFNSTSKLGDVDYGPDAIVDLNSMCLRFFDQYLKDKPVIDKLPKAQVFVTGANEWRTLDSWPDSRSKPMSMYLSSDGPANGQESVGKLTAGKPGVEEPDRYTYNPAAEKIDAKEIEMDPDKGTTVMDFEKRNDAYLYYRSEPFTQPMDIGGPISCDLYFSTTAVDTDFFVRLIDIDEKGAARLICMPGKIRAKFINSFDKPELLKPGREYKAHIDLWDTAHRFEKGHRMAILIESSEFPSYARNLNTGEPDATATRMIAASQTIFHDSKRPSALTFSILPPK